MCIDRKGVVKEEAFFTLLNLHGVSLSKKDQDKLKSECQKRGQIDYKKAVQSIGMDVQADKITPTIHEVDLDESASVVASRNQ